MNFNKLASAIAKSEGKKSQVKIGDVREVLSVLTHLEACHMAKGNITASPIDCLKKLSAKSSKKMIKAKVKKAKK